MKPWAIECNTFGVKSFGIHTPPYLCAESSLIGEGDLRCCHAMELRVINLSFLLSPCKKRPGIRSKMARTFFAQILSGFSLYPVPALE
jgi:hypothetical protein